MKKLYAVLLGLGLLIASSSNSFAAAITPDSIYQGTMGSFRVVVAYFSAGTADDGDTWASAMDGIVAYWTQDTDNPSTQASVGVAAALSSGTFTFYPAEDNKPFYLFVLQRG